MERILLFEEFINEVFNFEMFKKKPKVIKQFLDYCKQYLEKYKESGLVK